MINRPDLRTFTNPSPIQAQFSSHRFTSKSEQNTTTYHSHWNPREKSSSSCSWRNALW